MIKCLGCGRMVERLIGKCMECNERDMRQLGPKTLTVNPPELNILINSILILQTEQKRVMPAIREIDPTQVDTGMGMVEALLQRLKKLREES